MASMMPWHSRQPTSRWPAAPAASAEAADVVLLVDQLDRLLPGIRIARRARQIALQSVYAGLGLSFAGMVAAAFGYISPVQEALRSDPQCSARPSREDGVRPRGRAK